MTLTDLLARKVKADALSAAEREKHAAVYADICDQIQARLIDLAMASEAYTQVFIQTPDNLPALTEAARGISEVTK